jgi:prepilin-type N-terminal cleavage/methylation domain-containing protein
MLRGPSTQRGAEAGLTLVEVLVSMIILSIITTGLVMAWVNLQRGANFAVAASNSRSAARDAISRISGELRAAQPTALPSPAPTETAMPAGQPPITLAGPYEVQFYSAYNVANAKADGTGVTAIRKTWIYLDTTGASVQKTLYLKRDMDGDGNFDGAGDRTIVLARNVVNPSIPDSRNGPSPGTTYTPLFEYFYRTAPTNPIVPTDNSSGTLVLSTLVAIRARVISDANIARTPKFTDATTTVRLRNASAN